MKLVFIYLVNSWIDGKGLLRTGKGSLPSCDGSNGETTCLPLRAKTLYVWYMMHYGRLGIKIAPLPNCMEMSYCQLQNWILVMFIHQNLAFLVHPFK